jgi:predicted TIM-barrel fold metal-dependent hydrolase
VKNGFRIMDSDLHVMEPPDLYERYLEPAFRERAPKFQKHDATGHGLSEHGVGRWLIEGRPYPAIYDAARYQRRYALLTEQKARVPEHMALAARGFDARATLEGMDIEGVDHAVMYRSVAGMLPIGVDGLAPDFAFALARAFNDWLHDFCRSDPQRLQGVAVIPLVDVEMAVAETRRVVEQLGFPGINIYPDEVDGRMLYDPEVDPLWAVAQDLGIAVGVHGTSQALSGADAAHKYLRHPAGGTVGRALGFPVHLLGASAGMILSGVLERFPRLRVAFLEGNSSWLPWWLYRLDEMWEKCGRAEEGEILELAPHEYFLRQCYASVDVDEAPVRHVIEEYGDDNLVFSTDFPHIDGAFPHATEGFLGLGIPEASKRKILWDNCARLYGVRMSATV